MNRILLFILATSFAVSILFAQDEIIAGNTHRIYSKNLDRQISLQVYLPQGYDNEELEYPTLYILDGHWYYLNGVAIQESIRGDRMMPKMIVIGIDMVDRPYRAKLFDQWESLIKFMETELVSFVDDNFRTSGRRVVFGWENSGYLVSDLILKDDSQFDCGIAASGAYVSNDSLTSLSTEKERFFFIAGSQKDIYSIDYTDDASNTLKSLNLAGLTWDYRLFNDEEHESLAYASMYQGLKFYFHNYGSLVFSSIDEFHKLGGMPYLRNYFQERGERFGMATSIDASTKNSLIWLAWKRDNFEAFDLFMTEFEDVLSTRRYASAYWQNRLAQYYLKYKAYDKSITYFERGINEYPNDRFMAAMYVGLGSAYFGKGERKLAKKHVKKGVELARAAQDSNLEKYENELDRVNE